MSMDSAALAWWHICDIEVQIGGISSAVVVVDLALTDKGGTLRLTTPEYDDVEHHELTLGKGHPADLARESVRRAFLHRALHLGKVTREGLLKRADLEELWREALVEREASRAFQRRRASEIVELASELGLAPDTDGLVRGLWEARCPGTSHTLEIQSQTDLFRCGYCRVGGGLAELRALVESRMARRSGD